MGNFSFAIPLSDEETRDSHSTQRHPLGARGVTVEGRVFHYVKNGATAGVRAILAGSATPGPWATATDNQLAVAAVAGATQIIMNDVPTGSVTADYYKDGFIWFNTTAGSQMLRIKSHGSWASGTGGSTGEADAPINLYRDQPVAAAIATNATESPRLQASPYMAVIPMPASLGAGLSQRPVGVYPIALAANYYGWLQTWGPAVLRIGDTAWTTVRGVEVFPCEAASTGGIEGPSTGQLLTDTATAADVMRTLLQPVGYAMSDLKAANFYAAVFLTLAP